MTNNKGISKTNIDTRKVEGGNMGTIFRFMYPVQ